MLFLLGSGRRSVNARAADSSIQAIQWFRSGPRDPLRRRPDGEGRKKTAGFAGGFSGISVALYAPSTLSIRQRSEMPKKVKIKLGGHDGDSVRQKS
nr:hypothetical protein [Burkholderia ambifaria]